ncbi:hypothetical protein JCM37172_20140 [Faecalimonas hominis]
MFPRPTAEPAAASTNPILLEKLLRCDIIKPSSSFKILFMIIAQEQYKINKKIKRKKLLTVR